MLRLEFTAGNTPNLMYSRTVFSDLRSRLAVSFTVSKSFLVGAGAVTVPAFSNAAATAALIMLASWSGEITITSMCEWTRGEYHVSEYTLGGPRCYLITSCEMTHTGTNKRPKIPGNKWNCYPFSCLAD